MKYLVVILNRLAQYIKKNKTVFMLFIVGGMVNAMAFAYLYGNADPVLYNANSTDAKYRTYEVGFNCVGGSGISFRNPEKEYITENDINKVIESGVFETVIVRMTLGQIVVGSGETRPRSYSACFYGIPDYSLDTGTLELKSNDQVLAPFDEYVSVGSKVVIAGKQFNVVGTYIGGYDYILTPEAYKSLNPYTNHLTVISNDRWYSGYTEADVPERTLHRLMPEAYVHTPVRWENQDHNRTTLALKNARNSFAVSAIAFMFMVIYMADSLAEENSASIIVGARPVRIATCVFMEGIIFSTVATALGLLAHFLLYEDVFNKINIYPNIPYTANTYVRLLIVMVLVQIVVMLIVAARYLLLTPYRQKSKRGFIY